MYGRTNVIKPFTSAIEANLLRKLVNYGRKSFKALAPGANFVNLFPLSTHKVKGFITLTPAFTQFSH
jgi:hypothetical protein